MQQPDQAQFQSSEPVEASQREPALPFRGDTFLGVCEAIGNDLGFNPNWLRIPFGALLLWNPEVIVGSYLALGCVVALSRWLYPVRPAASVNEARAPVRTGEANAIVEATVSEKELLAA